MQKEKKREDNMKRYIIPILVIMLAFTNVASVSAAEAVYVIDDGVEETVTNEFKAEIDKVHSIIKNMVLDSGWTMHITTDKLAQTLFNGKYPSVMAATVYSTKVIWFENRQNIASSCVIHEFGHALDDYYDCISFSDEWVAIFDAERFSFAYSKTSHDGMEQNYKQEFFASVFDDYFSSPNTLKETAPMAYNAMDMLIQESCESYLMRKVGSKCSDWLKLCR